MAPVTGVLLLTALRSKLWALSPRPHTGTAPSTEPMFSPTPEQPCLQAHSHRLPCPHGPLPPTRTPGAGEALKSVSEADPAETKALRTLQTAMAGPEPGGFWLACPGPCLPWSPMHQWGQHSLAGRACGDHCPPKGHLGSPGWGLRLATAWGAPSNR